MINKIITIGREFGSGGHEIGEKLAERLHIPLYDRELIGMAARELGVDPKSLIRVDERTIHGFMASYRPDYRKSLSGYRTPINDSVYVAQCNIIEKLAHMGPCIIVGRCADDVLSDYAGLINVFICASMPYKVRRVSDKYRCDEEEAEEMIRQIDKRRKSYYETYAGKKWGSPESHQLVINISRLGQERTLSVIEELYQIPT